MKLKIFICILLCLGVTCSSWAKEDLVHWQDIDLQDGMDQDEADMIAIHYYHLTVNPCGKVGQGYQKKKYYEYPIFIGFDEDLYQYPLKVYKKGKVKLKGYKTYKNIESMPVAKTIKETSEHCYEDPSVANIFMKAIERGDLKFVKKIVEDGASMDKPYMSYYYATPLVHAVSVGAVEIVEYMLSQGAQPYYKDKSLVDPVGLAQIRGYKDIEILLQKKIEELDRKEGKE